MLFRSVSQSRYVSREDFMSKVDDITVKIGDNTFVAKKKVFQSGSFGFNLTGKTHIVVDGKVVALQVGLNMTVIGSKPEKVAA